MIALFFVVLFISLIIMYHTEIKPRFKVGDTLVSAGREEWEDEISHVVDRVGKNNYLIYNKDMGHRTISFRMANLRYEKKEIG